MKPFKFQIKTMIPDFHALWITQDGRLYGSRGRKLLLTEDWGKSFTMISELPSTRLSWGNSFRLSSRRCAAPPIRRQQVNQRKHPHHVAIQGLGKPVEFFSPMRKD